MTFLQSGLRVVPGVWDGLSAKIATAVGFETVLVSSRAVASAFGISGSLATYADLTNTVRRICGATTLPVVARVVSEGGTVSQAAQAVRDLERAGAAGVLIEGPMTLSVTEAICDARRGRELVVIAGVQARNGDVERLVSQAIELHAAGSDVVSIDGLRSKDDGMECARRMGDAGIPAAVIDCPMTTAEAESLGIRLQFIIDDLMTNVYRQLFRGYVWLRDTGDAEAVLREIRENSEGVEDISAMLGLAEVYRNERLYNVA